MCTGQMGLKYRNNVGAKNRQSLWAAQLGHGMCCRRMDKPGGPLWTKCGNASRQHSVQPGESARCTPPWHPPDTATGSGHSAARTATPIFVGAEGQGRMNKRRPQRSTACRPVSPGAQEATCSRTKGIKLMNTVRAGKAVVPNCGFCETRVFLVTEVPPKCPPSVHKVPALCISYAKVPN